ncbi:MAG TPA: T9SS type A sorting domain-containing protein [Prolixibacteraceae bacterium]|nr:T9SS type A sorting domain-containing protein [Prolixibacteraceae bacterium]
MNINLLKIKKNGSITNHLKKMAVALSFLICTSMAFAQVEMVWTGASSNNFMIEDNWEPAGSPQDNILTIPLQFDTLGNALYANAPVISGSENISVKEITVAIDKARPELQGKYTVDLESLEDTLVLDNGSKNIQYNSTGIVINNGTVLFKSYKRFDVVGTYMIVNGGHVEFTRFLIMRDGNNMETGGHVTINGGTVKLNGGFHDRVNKTMNQITITGDGILIVAGNYGSTETDIESGWIDGGENFSIKRTYDPIANITTYSAVPATYIGIENADRQVLKNGEATTDTLKLLNTNAVATATTFQWRYKVKGEDTFTMFSGEGANTNKFAPVFDASGTYMVSCLVNGTATENEVEFYVVSSAISFAPAEFGIQFLRLGETGTTITAQFTTEPTQTEWKYGTTPGGPYMPFEPAQTAASINPTFNETGNHYLVMIATIDGQSHTSTELLYNIEDATAVGKNLTWTGLISTDPKDPANWEPVAHYFRNNITINNMVTEENPTPNYPVFNMAGNDTINKMVIKPGAQMDIVGRESVVDTFNMRSDLYVEGVLNVYNTMIDYTSYFWRMPVGTSYMNMTGDASLSILADYNGGPSFISMGNNNTPTQGGYLKMNDNSKLYMAAFHRMVTALNDSSVFDLSDNAQIWFKGDGQAEIATYIDSTKIRCSDEGFEPYVTFDGEWTIVSARNVNAFALDNDARTYTTPNAPTADPIGLINTDGIDGWEWKWAAGPNGPWNSFDPVAADQASYAPVFAEPGVYYIVAFTNENVQTTNMKEVNVVDLSISPADDQVVDQGEPLQMLTVNIPEEVEFLAGMWLIDDSDGNMIETGVSDIQYTPEITQIGSYKVYFYADVQDADGNAYTLFSNKVNIQINEVQDTTAVDEFNLALDLYPNPTNGTFYINTGFDKNYKVTIINMAGISVYEKEFYNNGPQVVTFNIKGAYIVKAQAENAIRISRLIVK